MLFMCAVFIFPSFCFVSQETPTKYHCDGIATMKIPNLAVIADSQLKS